MISKEVMSPPALTLTIVCPGHVDGSHSRRQQSSASPDKSSGFAQHTVPGLSPKPGYLNLTQSDGGEGDGDGDGGDGEADGGGELGGGGAGEGDGGGDGEAEGGGGETGDGGGFDGGSEGGGGGGGDGGGSGVYCGRQPTQITGWSPALAPGSPVFSMSLPLPST